MFNLLPGQHLWSSKQTFMRCCIFFLKQRICFFLAAVGQFLEPPIPAPSPLPSRSLLTCGTVLSWQWWYLLSRNQAKFKTGSERIFFLFFSELDLKISWLACTWVGAEFLTGKSSNWSCIAVTRHAEDEEVVRISLCYTLPWPIWEEEKKSRRDW